jgi:predicted dehydrogenase
MRVGVLGCGYWGSKHVRVLSGLPQVAEVVIIDPRPDRRRNLQASFPAARAVGTLDEALPHMDAVVVATPPETHAELALRALRAGKHVMVEKPLATTTSDGLRMQKEAESSGLTLMTGHTFEYNPAVTKLREVIDSGELGDLYYLDTARLNLGIYQSRVNVAWDLAPHDISIANYLLGSVPSEVQAWGSTHAHRFLEDVAYLRLEYPDRGVTAHIHVSWLDPCKVRRVTAVGSQKMAVYNDLAGDERLRIYDKGVEGHGLPEIGEEMHHFPVHYRQGGMHAPFIDLAEPLRVEDEHFVDCCLTGRTPRSDGYSGVAVVGVLEAADTSLREGRAVRLEELLEVAAA